jgi:hypothetical protein
MKYFFPMLCVVVAGGAGYMFEPKITPNLISDIKVKERVTVVNLDEQEAEKEKEKKAPALPKVDPVPEPPPVAKVDPVPMPPVPQPPPDPEPVAQTDPVPTPEPTPEVTPPAPTPAPSAAQLSEAEIVSVMQESIKSGRLTEFTFEQGVKWEAASEEEVDGVKYQVGLATFRKETILGPLTTMHAKALLKDGKVAKWVWKTSGLEIK